MALDPPDRRSLPAKRAGGVSGAASVHPNAVDTPAAGGAALDTHVITGG